MIAVLRLNNKIVQIATLSLVFHLLFLFTIKFENLKKEHIEIAASDLIKLKLVNMNLGLKNGEGQGQYLRQSDDEKSTKLNKHSYKKIKDVLDRYDQVETDPAGKKLQLADLMAEKLTDDSIKRQWRPKPVELKGSEIQKYLKDNNVRRMQYQDYTPTLNNSQVSVQMDIPEGFEIEKIDQIQNVFYSFQRRISLAYVNAFYNNLSDFEFKNPHLQFPMTKDEITMVAKATFDANGNLQKIQMMKWTNMDKLQQFFVSVLDNIQTIPNPPKEFVKGKQTFNIYYSLKLN